MWVGKQMVVDITLSVRVTALTLCAKVRNAPSKSTSNFEAHVLCGHHRNQLFAQVALSTFLQL